MGSASLIRTKARELNLCESMGNCGRTPLTAGHQRVRRSPEWGSAFWKIAFGRLRGARGNASPDSFGRTEFHSPCYDRKGGRIWLELGGGVRRWWCLEQGFRVHLRASKGLKEVCAPYRAAVPREAREHGGMALTALDEGHVQGARNCAHNRIRIIRIHQQRLLALDRGAGKPPQDEHSGIVGVLGSDIFLGDEVHAISERRHERRVCRTVDAGESRSAVSAIEVANRGPGNFTVHAVDTSRSGAHSLFEFVILRDLGSALRRDLE